MKSNLIYPLLLILTLAIAAGCRKSDDEPISPEQKALIDIKGTYTGLMAMTSPHDGNEISVLGEVEVQSEQSLKFNAALHPLAYIVEDPKLSLRLREIGSIPISATYSFTSIHDKTIHFVLNLQTYSLPLPSDPSREITFRFAPSYGGLVDLVQGKFMIFNVCLEGITLDGKQITELPKILYHFEGEISKP